MSLTAVVSGRLSALPRVQTHALERVRLAELEFVPRHREWLGAADAQRATTLIRDFLDRHPFEVVVQRTAQEGQQLLDGTAPRLRTAFDGPVPGTPLGQRRSAGYLQDRIATERRLDLHGTGPSAGTTVYGALEIPGVIDRAADSYGTTRMVIDPRVLPRSTVTWSDSMNVARSDVAPVSRLDEVVVDALGEFEIERILTAPPGATDDAIRDGMRFLRDTRYVEFQLLGGVGARDVGRMSMLEGSAPMHDVGWRALRHELAAAQP